MGSTHLQKVGNLFVKLLTSVSALAKWCDEKREYSWIYVLVVGIMFFCVWVEWAEFSHPLLSSAFFLPVLYKVPASLVSFEFCPVDVIITVIAFDEVSESS